MKKTVIFVSIGLTLTLLASLFPILSYFSVKSYTLKKPNFSNAPANVSTQGQVSNLTLKSVNSLVNSQSNWSPINLIELNNTLNQKIKDLNQKISNVKAQKINDAEKNKALNSFQKSLEIQKVTLYEYQLMDKNQDKQISNDEFNLRIVNLSEKIYQIRHNKLENKENGILNSNGQKINPLASGLSSSGKDILMVIVEAGIYNDILGSLTQYKADVEREYNYNVQFYLCNGCTKEEIKTLLKESGTIGTLLIGDLPVAWYHVDNCFGKQETFPTDLYFMDLDGQWSGQESCGYGETCFTQHQGNVSPEIFYGRLTAPEEDSEVRLINNYFNKNHLYRNNLLNLADRSLDYISTDYINISTFIAGDIAIAYPNYELINNPQVISANDLKSRFNNNYEHLFIAAHSSPYSSSLTPGIITWDDIKNLRPHFNFYNLFACSNALYTVENYMAGWYIFQESNYGLISIGTTKTGGMQNFRGFYEPLVRLNNFGLAFKDWFSQGEAKQASVDKCSYGGMVLLGDPTLKVNNNQTSITPTIIPSLTPGPTKSPLSVGISCQTLLNQIKNVFGATCQNYLYNPVADINKDKIVNILDFSNLAANSNNEAWCQNALNNLSNPCSYSAVIPSVTPTPTVSLTFIPWEGPPNCRRPNQAICTNWGRGPLPGDNGYQGWTKEKACQCCLACSQKLKGKSPQSYCYTFDQTNTNGWEHADYCQGVPAF